MIVDCETWNCDSNPGHSSGIWMEEEEEIVKVLQCQVLRRRAKFRARWIPERIFPLPETSLSMGDKSWHKEEEEVRSWDGGVMPRERERGKAIRFTLHVGGVEHNSLHDVLCNCVRIFFSNRGQLKARRVAVT